MIKHVTEIDSEFIARLDSDLQEIKKGLQKMHAIPQDEWLTTEEFMRKIKVSRWMFDAFVREGILKYKKIGRKYYIPADQVAKYFEGKIKLS